MAYAYGTISEDIRDIFSGIDISGKYYVMWRDSQYDYCMYVCDEASYAGNGFSCSSGTLYTYDTEYRQNLNDPVTWVVSERSSYNISTSGTLVFSNVSKSFPQLGGAKQYEGSTIVSFSLCVLLVFLIVRDIFSEVLLRRRSKLVSGSYKRESDVR